MPPKTVVRATWLLLLSLLIAAIVWSPERTLSRAREAQGTFLSDGASGDGPSALVAPHSRSHDSQQERTDMPSTHDVPDGGFRADPSLTGEAGNGAQDDEGAAGRGGDPRLAGLMSQQLRDSIAEEQQAIKSNAVAE